MLTLIFMIILWHQPQHHLAGNPPQRVVQPRNCWGGPCKL